MQKEAYIFSSHNLVIAKFMNNCHLVYITKLFKETLVETQRLMQDYNLAYKLGGRPLNCHNLCVPYKGSVEGLQYHLCYHISILSRASPPQNCNWLLYVKIEQCLMIIVPTHKRHKSPFKQSKTILYLYIWTSSHCPNPQQKKDFEGVKMTAANWTSIQGRSRIDAILLQDLMKRCVCRCEVEDALSTCVSIVNTTQLHSIVTL